MNELNVMVDQATQTYSPLPPPEDDNEGFKRMVRMATIFQSLAFQNPRLVPVRWTTWFALAMRFVWRSASPKRGGNMSNVPCTLVCCFVLKRKLLITWGRCIVNLIQTFATCGAVCCAFAVNLPRFNRASAKTTPIGCFGPAPRKSASSFGGPTNLWAKSTRNGFTQTHQKSQNILYLPVMLMDIPSVGMTSQVHHPEWDAKRMCS